jgi:ferredoxin
MAYKITSQCISCDRCLSACPTDAIKTLNGRHWIDPELCKDCTNTAYSVPQCAAACPTANGCIPAPTDYWEWWFASYSRTVNKLKGKQDYWERWFNSYSEKFSNTLSPRERPVLGV